VKSTPVPGEATTMNDTIKKSMLMGAERLAWLIPVQVVYKQSGT
jgi:hypothetical protein